MKLLMLLFILVILPSARAGEIQNYYLQQNKNPVGNTNVVLSPRFQSTNHGITEIGIERTPCFGTCPAYFFIVRGDGAVRYRGEKHVERLREWEAKIEPYKFHNLANFIAQSDYDKMSDTFDRGGYDGETVYTTFVMKGRRTVVRNYSGSGPMKLWALEELIDGLLAEATWHSTNTTPVAPKLESPTNKAPKKSAAVIQRGLGKPAEESATPTR